MARKKVKLAWIANDSARKATFKKRKKGLMKKASELSVLCDVKACAVVYAPGDPQPEVWPSVPDAMKVLATFKSVPEMEKTKKMMNQEGFLRQRISKLQEQLQKQEKENRELESRLLLYQGLEAAAAASPAPVVAGGSVGAMGIEEVTCLAWMVEMRAKGVLERIERRMVEKQEEKKTAAATAAAEEVVQGQEWFMKVVNGHQSVGEGLVHGFADHYDPFLESLFSN